MEIDSTRRELPCAISHLPAATNYMLSHGKESLIVLGPRFPISPSLTIGSAVDLTYSWCNITDRSLSLSALYNVACDLRRLPMSFTCSLSLWERCKTDYLVTTLFLVGFSPAYTHLATLLQQNVATSQHVISERCCNNLRA